MAAFYPLPDSFSTASLAGFAATDSIVFRLLRVRSEVEKIVHRMPEILFAAEIAFRGLHRCMSEQELNLLQLTAAIVA